MSIDAASRDIRRIVYAQERRERVSGKWSPFEVVPQDEMLLSRDLSAVQFGNVSRRGWTHQVTEVYHNGWIAVMVRPVVSDLLGITIHHAAIRTALSAELGWKELQRLKDEIFGTDRMAVQVYPRRCELVDAADMYHLWVFPPGYIFDFGLGGDQK